MDGKRIDRIKKMEKYLDKSKEAIDELEKAISEYEKIERDYYKLENYYGSVKWMDDYEADESGELPEDLKRGVLSEDLVYDLITEHRELMTRLHEAVYNALKNGI